ncbi:hypothetical protein [Alloactinosynnema sp. L-07]|nr:hypothetical protein [Alloactinosynnema sp. L-07]
MPTPPQRACRTARLTRAVATPTVACRRVRAPRSLDFVGVAAVDWAPRKVAAVFCGVWSVG